MLFSTNTTVSLYSTNRAERKRASVKQQSLSSNLFILERTDQSGQTYFSPAPQVQEVCQEVDEFIYVANAETGREYELSQHQAGSTRLPSRTRSRERSGWFHQATVQDQSQ